MTWSEILSLYGALLASVLAAFQIRSHLRTERALHVEVRSGDEPLHRIELAVRNRTPSTVHITSVGWQPLASDWPRRRYGPETVISELGDPGRPLTPHDTTRLMIAEAVVPVAGPRFVFAVTTAEGGKYRSRPVKTVAE